MLAELGDCLSDQLETQSRAALTNVFGLDAVGRWLK